MRHKFSNILFKIFNLFVFRFHKITFPFINQFIVKNGKIDIRLDLTKQCNLKCVYCHYSLPDTVNSSVHNLSLEDIKKIFEGCKNSIRQINLSCGHEPLINQESIQILEYLSQNHPKVFIYFVSNCTLLTEKKRSAVVSNKVDLITFSIDAASKVNYEKIRRGSRFEKVISNILALKKLKEDLNITKPAVNAIFVMLNSNIHEAAHFLNLTKFLGIESVTFHHLVKEGAINYEMESLFMHKAKYNYFYELITTKSKEIGVPITIPDPFQINEEWIPSIASDIEIDDVYKILPDDQKEKITCKSESVHKYNTNFHIIDKFKPRCSFPFKEVHVKEKRFVKPCAYLSGPPLGDLKKDGNILDIFKNEEFTKLRKSMFSNTIDKRCLKCPLVAHKIKNNR